MISGLFYRLMYMHRPPEGLLSLCVCAETQDALKLNKFSFTTDSGVEEVRAALGGLDGGVGDKVNAILA